MENCVSEKSVNSGESPSNPKHYTIYCSWKYADILPSHLQYQRLTNIPSH